MARKPYAEDQNIHSMTTRQLRQYIADKTEEAQQRLNTIEDLSEASRAFRDLADIITNDRGKVKRSTSYMSKEEMREYAYTLRTFNQLDVSSSFAKSVEWKENKKKYQAFIRNRIAEGDDYWKKYLTPKGNVSKRGYQDYKDYINFIKSIKDVQNQYGYRTLKQYGIQFLSDKNIQGIPKDIGKILNNIFQESKGKGLTQKDLIEMFEIRLQDEMAKLKPVRPKKSKSKQNIKAKTARKMKTHGTVRERIT